MRANPNFQDVPECSGPKNQLKAYLGLGLAKLRVLGYFQGVPVFRVVPLFRSVPVFLVLVHAVSKWKERFVLLSSEKVKANIRSYN